MTHTPANVETSKSMLEGVTLESGWTLVERLNASPNSTGGNFGVGYRAKRGNDLAFVKAIDFWDALRAPDPFAEVSKLTQIANFERDVLEYCHENRMTRVLSYVGSEYVWAGDRSNPMNRVLCLILEAGHADLRRLLGTTQLTSSAWNLQVLRDVAQAIAQLHRGDIAHQDIKPSNIISFGAPSTADSANVKVGDLGRVVRKNHAGPFDGLAWPGDMRYSPPERWYGHTPPDWCDARESADAYMLGSLLLYLFTGTPIQPLVLNIIPASFRPDKWSGRYDHDLLPVLVNCHIEVLKDHLLPALMPEVADLVMNVARALTQPDPAIRGDARARRQIGRPVGMDRIHQRVSEAALKCAAIERGKMRAVA